MCSSWAVQGECEANKAYMLGEGTGNEGACLASCRACHLMKDKPAPAHEEMRHL